jgi:hypothetical protein
MASPPNWFLNPINGVEFIDYNKHWSLLPDFGNEIGDIKNIWETSRFSWINVLARAYKVSGNEIYLSTINEWLLDWTNRNPVNIGPNWKCGQETSIRLINFLNCLSILNQENNPTENVLQFIKNHLERIEPNIRYAIAQRNNHATSEIAALYIGFAYLSKFEKKYTKKANSAAVLLIDIITKILYKDGSFAQHSVTYHRLFLDTLSFVEFWRRELDYPTLNQTFYENAKKASLWLSAIIDIESGDAPNFGANDGALLLNTNGTDYRNFIPSLQTAFYFFYNELPFEHGIHNESLYWMKVNVCEVQIKKIQKVDKLFDSGYLILKNDVSWLMFRFPKFKFRPSHNDAFHIDIWYKGKNILIDSGSYSYNPGKNYHGIDLKSVNAHNTLAFKGNEQMPRLSRFLMAKWIQSKIVSYNIDESNCNYTFSYSDYKGNTHTRKITKKTSEWVIDDHFTGPSQIVNIGFNFTGENYQLDKLNNQLILNWGSISWNKNLSNEIIKTEHSKYYWQKETNNRLVIESNNQNTVQTIIKLN